VKTKSFWVAAGLQALCIGGAQAQDSSVTVYGVADVFVEFGKAGTAAAPVKNTRVQSGGANGSRLGFRGSEDLGSGLKANFVIEHGLLLDSGTAASSAFWNRQAHVGLSGGWGSLSAGRQYSPLIVHQDSFDPSLSTTGYGSPYNSGVMRTISRVNNSVLYNAPKLGPVSTALMVGFGETGGGTRAGSTVAASARYNDGPFGAGVGWGKQFKLDAAREDKSIWNVAGKVTLGSFTLMAAVQGTRNDSQALATADDRSEFLVGGTYTAGPVEVRATLGQGKVKDVADTTARHASVGALYHLSKRSALWAAVQAIDNPDNLAYRTSGFTFDAIEGGLPAGAGVTARALALGFRHRF
jgi:predicted porin